MTTVDHHLLHASLRDPVLSVPVFHTSVMSRYPDAISFAPGAPNPAFAEHFDATAHVERFLEHLRADEGLSDAAARTALYEYGPGKGLVTGLIAEALRRDFGLATPRGGVVVTVGAQEAMLLLLRALRRDADDLFAAVDPCFIGFSGAARLVDAELVPVAEVDGGLDLDGLARACADARSRGKRVRALYVAPDHANPSGTVLDLATRRRLLDLAEAEDFLLVEDTTYAFTAEPGAALPMLKQLDTTGRVVLLGTFSKIALPGARVGYVVADQPVRRDGATGLLADDLAALKGMISLHTPAVGQAVVGGMLLAHGGSLVELGRPKAELYRRNLRLLLAALEREIVPGDGLPAVTWNRPTGGFFVRMRLPVKADARLMETSASKYGVLWTPMSQFHLAGAGTDEIRLSCSFLTPEEIEEGVRRLADFLRGLGG
ncbi:aminotransferase class I/II-fold pyridoxal phosphate-dependent enzyme [Saccharothrix australiensis]|uniref:Hydroxyphenylglycine aminotransferase n=1 Tax=Saccharothrix australiensis TaxID=2072 RepID=A0A495W4C7_9PSEU|nr:PLP-dependent aminotransferase family protein [Saccharothrix australiensis]RKT54658.1 hydroxyphenylglycine aminotransferase [Saccharothrix australiensis]